MFGKFVLGYQTASLNVLSAPLCHDVDSVSCFGLRFEFGFLHHDFAPKYTVTKLPYYVLHMKAFWMESKEKDGVT